jgi:amidase
VARVARAAGDGARWQAPLGALRGIRALSNPPVSRRFDAVVTPALALTPRPVGWYFAEDAERNFAQRCSTRRSRPSPYVSGLPAITLPVAETVDGLPMGICRWASRRRARTAGHRCAARTSPHWQRRHPPQC